MIELYTWLTSNGRKATIMLEEVELAYTVHPINIAKGDQFAPDFLAINPNGKIPAMIDQDAEGGPAVQKGLWIPKRPFRRGLSGRYRCDSRKVVETDLEPPCGRRPPESSIAARRCVIRLI